MKPNHYFTYKHEEGWQVKCEETKGDFSTAIWKKGKTKQNNCPCCNKKI